MELNITEQLKIIADRKNISYTDISKKLDISPQAVSQMFKKGIKKLDDVEKIADILGCYVDISIKEKI